MSVLESQAPTVKFKLNGQIFFSFSKELIQVVWASQRIVHPQGKTQKVQCHSKFENCDFFSEFVATIMHYNTQIFAQIPFEIFIPIK